MVEDAGDGAQPGAQVAATTGRAWERGFPGLTKWQDHEIPQHLVSLCSPPPFSFPTAAMSKRVRIFTLEDVAEHHTATSCWVTRNGKVYDVTNFLPDHPGGDDLILKYAGKDIGDVMKDASEHEHSEAAYDMLDDFVIGRVGAGEQVVSEGTSQ